jgi:hypothetical protein
MSVFVKMILLFSSILILPKVRANTRFAPTSDAGSHAMLGANLLFARPGNAKIGIAIFYFFS